MAAHDRNQRLVVAALFTVHALETMPGKVTFFSMQLQESPGLKVFRVGAPKVIFPTFDLKVPFKISD